MENGTLVNRLKAYMEYTGLSNTQFADRAGIPRPTLSQILSGRNKKINNELIDKLHIAFPRLNVIWLLFGEGSMTEDGTTQNCGSEPAENRTDTTARTDASNDVAVDAIKIGMVHDYETPAVYGQPKTTPQGSLFDSDRREAYNKPYTNERKTTAKPNTSTDPKQTQRVDTP